MRNEMLESVAVARPLPAAQSSAGECCRGETIAAASLTLSRENVQREEFRVKKAKFRVKKAKFTVKQEKVRNFFLFYILVFTK